MISRAAFNCCLLPVTYFARPRQGTRAQGVHTHCGLDPVLNIYIFAFHWQGFFYQSQSRPRILKLHLVHHDPGGSIFRFLGAQ